MIEVKLWILTGVNAVIFPLLIFFISRWMKESDKEKTEYKSNVQSLNTQMSQINLSLSDIRLTIEQNKSWMCERFISEKEFVRRMEDMKEDMKEVQTRAGVFTNHCNGK
jgi:hypothetical protein